MSDALNPHLTHALQAFRALVCSLRGQVGTAWLEIDLTLAQLKALTVICTKGRIHGHGLAQILGVGQPTVSKLVERGYVRREDDRTDRRIVWLQPTDAGQALFERLALAGQERFIRLLETLRDDELATVRAALLILAEASQRLTHEKTTIR